MSLKLFFSSKPTGQGAEEKQRTREERRATTAARLGLEWPADFKRSAPGRPDKAWYYKQVLHTALNRDAYDLISWSTAHLLHVAERAGGSSEVLVLDAEEAEAGQEAEAGEEAAEAG
eukprot:701904-Amphidinium_carterae.1